MKKIMFNDKYGLTQAVLEGRKTQTRRICKEQIWAHSDIVSAENGIYHFESPKYKVGEVVAVAQSYKDCGYSETALDISPKDYKTARGTLGASKGWNNKMFVRADACKHQIRITDVRVERLQDISDVECLKEGIQKMLTGCEYYQYSFYDNDKGLWNNYKTPREAFAHLINKVSKKGTWESNPYVWIYDFERIK